MDRLVQKAPKAVMIDGQRYELNANFRNCLLTAYALEDEELADWEKAEILIENLYYEPYPENVQEAINQGVKFLMCGDTDRKEIHEKLCDLRLDSSMIYAALLKQGVDLDKSDDMHWWTFMSHFAEIGESTFSRIVYLRQQHHKGKLTKEERQEAHRIGWDIINMVTPEQKEQAKEDAEPFEQYLNGEME